MSTLVIVAHPDDECLGAGGMIVRLKNVSIVAFTDGIGARGQYHAEVTKGDRQRHYVDAMACLSATMRHTKPWEHWTGDSWETGWPDNQLDRAPLLDIVRAVESILDSIKPDAIYTHHLGDLNVDHRRMAEAVLTATRPGGNYPVKDVYAMEIPSSTEWTFGQIEPRFTPNVFVDITDTIERKLNAFACYVDEVRPSPHPRSLDMIRARARYWGSVAGYAYAEPFQLVRSLR